ncbi:hypothetical protein G5V58_07845 [Nocardioides anomalus]|uniref:Uncharacterized protein n=1 Tax=Nocardioides anomalus TaxID=2712223 RepID=A0A6G6WC23_9ACTN|nr:hypothetical protein [Nocardioides anomalus]QIG42707.1 hypothetical protein G5V58_07845 [Nocardioides anomalus]
MPDLPPDAVPSWVRARLRDLEPLVDALLDVPSAKLDGPPPGAAGAGGLAWFDASLATSPALAAAGEDLRTAWLLGFGVHAAWRAHTAVDQNLPTLRAFRQAESARMLAAAGRRLGR